MKTLFFEDFAPGWTDTFGPVKVSKDDIITFASEYDPQVFHVDEEKAANTFAGRLIASGWHSCSLASRILVDNLLNRASSLGSPGIEEARWIAPVFPNDELFLEATVTDTRTSKSRPDIGLVQFLFKLCKQDGAVSTAIRCWIFFRRREPDRETETSKAFAGVMKNAIARDPEAIPTPVLTELACLDVLKPGTVTHLGSHVFQKDEIVRFARAYDPQYFHLDAEAAKDSLFGNLCASGWNTSANWMRCFVRTNNRRAELTMENGNPVPQIGPSPGFTNLKWLKPVFVGDEIHYRSEFREARPSRSRPGWGLAFNHNVGINQNGERVFEFDSVVFWQMSLS